eukprot:350658-Chlamydomonas_euryale.AAC.3
MGGDGRFWSVLCGDGRFWSVLCGDGRFQAVMGGDGRFRAVLGGSGRMGGADGQGARGWAGGQTSADGPTGGQAGEGARPAACLDVHRNVHCEILLEPYETTAKAAQADKPWVQPFRSVVCMPKGFTPAYPPKHPQSLKLHARAVASPPPQNEAALAVFAQKLRNFRPAATVLEAEIATVRNTFTNPMLDAAAKSSKSNDVSVLTAWVLGDERALEDA